MLLRLFVVLNVVVFVAAHPVATDNEASRDFSHDLFNTTTVIPTDDVHKQIEQTTTASTPVLESQNLKDPDAAPSATSPNSPDSDSPRTSAQDDTPDIPMSSSDSKSSEIEESSSEELELFEFLPGIPEQSEPLTHASLPVLNPHDFYAPYVGYASPEMQSWYHQPPFEPKDSYAPPPKPRESFPEVTDRPSSTTPKPTSPTDTPKTSSTTPVTTSIPPTPQDSFKSFAPPPEPTSTQESLKSYAPPAIPTSTSKDFDEESTTTSKTEIPTSEDSNPPSDSTPTTTSVVPTIVEAIKTSYDSYARHSIADSNPESSHVEFVTTTAPSSDETSLDSEILPNSNLPVVDESIPNVSDLPTTQDFQISELFEPPHSSSSDLTSPDSDSSVSQSSDTEIETNLELSLLDESSFVLEDTSDASNESPIPETNLVPDTTSTHELSSKTKTTTSTNDSRSAKMRIRVLAMLFYPVLVKLETIISPEDVSSLHNSLPKTIAHLQRSMPVDIPHESLNEIPKDMYHDLPQENLTDFRPAKVPSVTPQPSTSHFGESYATPIQNYALNDDFLSYDVPHRIQHGVEKIFDYDFAGEGDIM